MNVARLETSLAGVVLLLAPGFAIAQAQSQPQQSPAELVKAVIANELKPSDGSDTRWKYRLDKETDGKLETRQVVETQSGSVDRLLSVAGKPLSDAQARDEAGRILRLVHDPDARAAMGAAGRKRALELYDEAKVLARTLDFLGVVDLRPSAGSAESRT